MPLSYVACMLADWFAMNEEVQDGSKDKILEWANKFLKVRCTFTDEQIDFIYDIIERVYD